MLKKIILAIFTLVMISPFSFAQNSEAQLLQRRIYLWDVSASMKGQARKKDANGNYTKEKTENIYNKVLKYLEDEINSITDESTEILVFPFTQGLFSSGGRVVVYSSNNATPAAKAKLISDIRNCDLTNPKLDTYIFATLDNVLPYMIQDKNNLLILLTDGEEEDKLNGERLHAKFKNEWNGYDELNSETISHLLIVKLTDQADLSIYSDLDRRTETDFTDGFMDIVDLTPSCSSFSLLNDDSFTLRISHKSSIILPKGVKLHIQDDGSVPGLRIDSHITMSGTEASVPVTFVRDRENVKHSMPPAFELPLVLTLENADEIKKSDKMILYIPKSHLKLNCINEKYKKLTISLY